MLTVEEIQFLLERINEKTVVEATPTFPFRISQKQHGYNDDPKISGLQAKLSIMLEVAARREA